MRKEFSRRDFLRLTGALTACGAGIAAGLNKSWWEWTASSITEPTPIEPPSPWSIEARYYASSANQGSLNCIDCHSENEQSLPVSYCHTPHTGSYVRCKLCPHNCVISEGKRGLCRVRENRQGTLYSMVFGNPCAVHTDPIEKKPFYHFLPTAAAFSLATAGCSLRCLYCQNWNISQVPPEETDNVDLPPSAVVSNCQRSQAPVIAYTYSEPSIFYEYMIETAQLARRAKLRNVVVSAGFINPEPLKELCNTVDAIKIDLKGMDEDFYRQVCQAELQPVLEAIRIIYQSGVHLEIVNLVVPTLNDDQEQMRKLAQFVAQELSPDVPLHFSRFYPNYKLLNLPPTPVETLDQARQSAMDEGVKFVYVGNVPEHPGNNTFCPNCGREIITRSGFAVLEYHLYDGACEYCGQKISGVWWSGGVENLPGKLHSVVPGS